MHDTAGIWLNAQMGVNPVSAIEWNGYIILQYIYTKALPSKLSHAIIVTSGLVFCHMGVNYAYLYTWFRGWYCFWQWLWLRPVSIMPAKHSKDFTSTTITYNIFAYTSRSSLQQKTQWSTSHKQLKYNSSDKFTL